MGSFNKFRADLLQEKALLLLGQKPNEWRTPKELRLSHATMRRLERNGLAEVRQGPNGEEYKIKATA